MRWPRLHRKRRVALAALVLAYACLMIFGGCADQLLLYPSTDPRNYPGMTRVEAASRGGPVEIWTMPTGEREPPGSICAQLRGKRLARRGRAANRCPGMGATSRRNLVGQLPRLWRELRQGAAECNPRRGPRGV